MPLPLRLPRWLSGEETACQSRRGGFEPWAGKIPWRRAWQPTPVLLPGEAHGQRSLAGFSPQGCNELDTTEQLGGLSLQERPTSLPSSCSAPFLIPSPGTPPWLPSRFLLPPPNLYPGFLPQRWQIESSKAEPPKVFWLTHTVVQKFELVRRFKISRIHT